MKYFNLPLTVVLSLYLQVASSYVVVQQPNQIKGTNADKGLDVQNHIPKPNNNQVNVKVPTNNSNKKVQNNKVAQHPNGVNIKQSTGYPVSPVNQQKNNMKANLDGNDMFFPRTDRGFIQQKFGIEIR